MDARGHSLTLEFDDDDRDAHAAARGDTRAFERLYLRHAGRIRSLARRLLGEAHADDGVQEVFVRAWSKLDMFRGDSAFGTWLYRLGTNVLLRQLEQSRKHDRVDVDRATIVVQPSASRTDIDRALLSLPVELREVVVLHDMEDHTHEEIGELLGITVSASKMRLHRARLALRTFMQERGDD
jgi:RNA polymerase sigma-70 factor (ECF subfamily)